MRPRILLALPDAILGLQASTASIRILLPHAASFVFRSSCILYLDTLDKMRTAFRSVHVTRDSSGPTKRGRIFNDLTKLHNHDDIISFRKYIRRDDIHNL